MDIRAAEISDIIRKQIENYDKKVSVTETGTVPECSLDRQPAPGASSCSTAPVVTWCPCPRWRRSVVGSASSS